MDIFLERHEEGIDNPNRSRISKESKFSNQIPANRSPGPHGYSNEFFQIFKEE